MYMAIVTRASHSASKHLHEANVHAVFIFNSRTSISTTIDT